MEIKSLIKNLQGNAVEKTASDKNNEPEKVAQATSTVDARMREVVAAATTEKRAAAGDSLQSLLTKEAQAFSDANDEAFIRRSKLGGTAFAEAAVETFNRAGQAADAVIKEASAGVDPEMIELAKMAQYNPARFLAEVQAGAASQMGQSKQASYDDTVHHWTTQHYLAGYESVRRAIGA